MDGWRGGDYGLDMRWTQIKSKGQGIPKGPPLHCRGKWRVAGILGLEDHRESLLGGCVLVDGERSRTSVHLILIFSFGWTSRLSRSTDRHTIDSPGEKHISCSSARGEPTGLGSAL